MPPCDAVAVTLSLCRVLPTHQAFFVQPATPSHRLPGRVPAPRKPLPTRPPTAVALATCAGSTAWLLSRPHGPGALGRTASH